MNKKSGIWILVSSIIIWVSLNTHMILEAKKHSNKITEKNKETEILMKKTMDEIKREYRKSKNLLVNSQKYHDTYFKQTFRIERSKHGANHIFLFNGKKYTTEYKEEK